MTDRMPKYSTADLIPILHRTRQTIQLLARRHHIGIRVANRKYLFSDHDITQLRELGRQAVGRPRQGRKTNGKKG